MNRRYRATRLVMICLLCSLLVFGVLAVGQRQPQPALLPASQAERVAYLTFDDGPSATTEAILDILKQYGVRATFFVTGQQEKYLPLVGRELAEGHHVGIHTYTHDFNEIYASADSFFADQNRMRRYLFVNYAYLTKDFRFPGGSSNTLVSRGILRDILEQAEQRRLRYHDWNVDTRDAVGARSAQLIIRNLERGLEQIGGDPAVILLHDIPTSRSVEALPQIIELLQNQGYRFDTVNNLKNPVVHRLK